MKKLFKHQTRALKKMGDKKVFALLMEMRTGKSLTVITRIKRDNLFPCLVITKNSITYPWKDEFADEGIDAVVLEGSSDKRKKVLKKTNAQAYIMNWESVRLIIDDLIKKGFKTVVADESIAIKNPKSKQTKSAHKLSRHVENKFILTGTPITKNPLDAWGQYYFLDPNILYFTSFWAFKNHYAHLVDRNFGGRMFKDVVGFKNIDELLRRIEPYSFSIRAKDCLDLPDVIYQTREVEMSKDMKATYKQLSTELVAELKTAHGSRLLMADNVLTKILRCQQLLGGLATDTDGQKIRVAENKTAEVLDIASEAGEQKLIVWARFLDEIERLTKALTDAGYKTEAIYGAVKPKERQAIINRLNEGDTKIIVAQQQTIGFGVDITGASIMIYYSNDYSLANRQQSEARNKGHKNKAEKIMVIDLITKGTLEKQIVNALQAKKKFQDLFFQSKVDAQKIMEGGITQ